MFFYAFTEELFELVQLSEVPVDKELFKVVSEWVTWYCQYKIDWHFVHGPQLLEMLKMNIAPVAILQVLKSLK